MIRDVIIYIILIARIVIAVRLLWLAARTVRSLYWLAAVFFVNAAYYVMGTGLFAVDSDVMHLSYTVGLTIAQVLVVMFTHSTFYQGRKSPFPVFLALSLVAGVVDILWWASAASSISLISLMVTVNWAWHAVVAYQAYRQVADEKYVEDWVKARYRLMIVYCALLASTGLMFLVYVLPSTSAGIQSLVGLLTLVGVVLQFLVWVMPERFRQYLNRNYQLEDLPEDEAAA
jgi:hypothetical protein